MRSMSFKRRVLSALGKDLLLEIGRGLELDVTTRMRVDELRDALAKSKRVTLDATASLALAAGNLALSALAPLDRKGIAHPFGNSVNAVLTRKLAGVGRGRGARALRNEIGDFVE